MTSTRSALDADWLGVCRRAVAGLAEMLADAPEHRRAGGRDRHARQRRRPHARDRPQRRDDRARRARRALRAEGYRFIALSEERGEVDYGDACRQRDHRPDRRLAERQARDSAPRAVDRRRRRARRWPTSRSRSSTTSARARSGGRGAARARGSTATRSIPALGERRGRDGRLEVLGIESADPRWVAASIDVARWTAPTACGRSGRSPRRSARSPPPGSTGWCRCGARAASTPPPAS